MGLLRKTLGRLVWYSSRRSFRNDDVKSGFESLKELRVLRYGAFLARHPIISLFVFLSVPATTMFIGIPMLQMNDLKGWDVRSGPESQRFDAFFIAQGEASMLGSFTGNVPERSVDVGFDVNVYFFAKESKNMLSYENLKLLLNVERQFASSHGYQAACLHRNVSGAVECVGSDSVLRSLCPEAALQPDGVQYAACGITQSTVDDWLRSVNATEAARYLSLDFLRPSDFEPAVGRLREAKAIRTTFKFGLPRAGYANPEISEEDQYLEMELAGKELFFEMMDVGRDLGDDVEVLVSWRVMDSVFALDALATDAAFMTLSIFFVLFYATLHMHSLFLSVSAVLMILVSFPSSFFFYRCFLGIKHFGTLQVLAIYIILGIGADDSFIFFDAWSYSREVFTSWERRMSYTFRRAAKAMLMTTLTTIAVFIATATSPILNIMVFGIFAAILILVNFLYDISIFPCIIVFHEKHVEKVERALFRFVTCRRVCMPGKKKAAPMPPAYAVAIKSSYAATHPPKPFDFSATGSPPPPYDVLAVVVEPTTTTATAATTKTDPGAISSPPAPSSPIGSPVIAPLALSPRMLRVLSEQQLSKLAAGSSAAGADRGTDVEERKMELVNLDFDAEEEAEDEREELEARAHGLGYRILHFPLVWKRHHERLYREKLHLPKDSRKAELYFGCYHYPLVNRLRFLFIALFLGVIIFLSYKGAQMKPSSSQFSDIWPASHPISVIHNLEDNEFADGNNMKNFLVWGLKPVDREGVGVFDPTDLGTLSYDESFDLEDPKAQIHMLRTCLDLQDASDSRSVECLMAPFAAWALDQNITGLGFPVDRDTFGFLNALNLFLSDPLYGKLGSFVGMVDNKLRFVSALQDLETKRSDTTADRRACYERMERWMGQRNREGPPSMNKGFQTSYDWVWLSSQETLVYSSARGLIVSVCIAFVVLLLMTGNLVISLLSTFCMGGIVACVIGSMVCLGWDLGMKESICITVLVGFSVDYVVHIGLAFIESQHRKRTIRVGDALAHIGVSVVGGAISTGGSSIFLLCCTIQYLGGFGQFLVMTVVYGATLSLFFFPALLIVFPSQWALVYAWPQWIRFACVSVWRNLPWRATRSWTFVGLRSALQRNKKQKALYRGEVGERAPAAAVPPPPHATKARELAEANAEDSESSCCESDTASSWETACSISSSSAPSEAYSDETEACK